MSPHDFLSALMALAGRFSFRETSGYRSKAGNTAVGGVQYTSHQFWLGRDVLLDSGENREEFIEAAKRLGLRPLDEGDHIHLQPAFWAKG